MVAVARDPHALPAPVRLAFCSNWERTETWIAAGTALRTRGVHVCFVITRDEYVARARAAGFPEQQILWLRRDAARRWPLSSADFERLRDYEARSGMQVKHCILMDRFLRSQPQDFALRYACYVFVRLLEFYDREGITLVSGQPDNIPDLLSLMIMRVHAGSYAAAFEFRLPAGRFMLWDSEIEQRPHVIGPASPAEVSDTHLQQAHELRERIRSGAKMRQAIDQKHQPGVGFRYLAKLTRGLLYRALVVSRHDAYMYTLGSVLFDLKFHTIALNRTLNRLLWKRLFSAPVAGERYVLYMLNYMPEHTIDVEAPWFISTFETVRNIARCLPSDVKLYVKEHPAADGIRGPRELARIARLPGVRLIDPFLDSHALIRGAELVVTLSGTASLEAALFGKWTAILSDIFIKEFSTCERIVAPWQVGELLARGPRPHGTEADDLRYLAWLLANSHPGTVIEPLSDPSSLDPPNVALIVDGYMRVLAALAAR